MNRTWFQEKKKLKSVIKLHMFEKRKKKTDSPTTLHKGIMRESPEFLELWGQSQVKNTLYLGLTLTW